MVTTTIENEKKESTPQLDLTPRDVEFLIKQKVAWRVKDCGDIFPGAVVPLGAVSDETIEFEIRVDKPFTVGATGHKRNGKSIFLTRAGVVAMVMGLPVWSNYPIEFNYINEEGKSKHHINQPLNWKSLYTLSTDLEYGVVIISEIQQWLDNRASMRLNNRLFSYILRQIGKRHLSLWYDCFSLDTIDKRLPAETDVEVYCEDIRKTFWGKTKGTDMEEGEYIKLTCYARSNAWLGFTTFESGVAPEYTLYGKPYWKCYDSYFLFDPFEALAGIELDLQKTKITNKASAQPLKENDLRQVIEACLRKGEYAIQAGNLWKSAGITNADSARHGDLTREMGLVRKRRDNGFIYDLTNYQPKEEEGVA